MSSRRSHRQKISTPGRVGGVELEAEVRAQEQSSNSATIDYDEVALLESATPAVKRRRKADRGTAKTTLAPPSVAKSRRRPRAKMSTTAADEPAAPATSSRVPKSTTPKVAESNTRADVSSMCRRGRDIEREENDDAQGESDADGQVTGVDEPSGVRRKRTRAGKQRESHLVEEAAGKMEERIEEPIPKMPPYPSIQFVPSRNVTTKRELAKEIITSEIQGLIREFGKDPTWKPAVQTCVEVGKELCRHVENFVPPEDEDPSPPLDLEGTRRILDEEKGNLAKYKEEERLWLAEEERLLASRAQDRECEEEDLDEEDDSSSERSEGLGTAEKISDQLQTAMEDMILKVCAIRRGLQEMGAGVVDAQEKKERLARTFRQESFKKYPNVDDPKSGIAALM